MRDVNDAHDPEHERQAGGEKSVQPANQRALDDCIDPIHDLLHAKIRELDLLSRKLVRTSFQCYAAFLHAVNTIRGLQGSVDILFYDQDCRPFSPDPRHGCVNVANDNRCKSKTELVTK